MKGYLLLSDGTKFHGTIIGATQNAIGEIVFNTGMTGYQEIVTDPSYFGQIVVLTYPMIGNYGIKDAVNQSKKTQVRGLVIRESDTNNTHWASEESLDDYLKKHNLVAIEGIDTRELTKMIRDKGNLLAQIVIDDKPASWTSHENYQPSYQVSTPSKYELGDGKYHIAVLDYGIKSSILKQLLNQDFRLTVYPAHTSSEEILSGAPDGIFLSNGPGDPDELEMVVEDVKALLVKPTFGICLGHQLIGKAFDCDTIKLKYGHRGPNHPVKDIKKDRVFITSQNHGYMLTSDSINKEILEVTHINVNDDSVEGVKHKSKPIFSVQYHPEASPGPDDSNYLFEEFEQMVKEAMAC